MSSAIFPLILASISLSTCLICNDCIKKFYTPDFGCSTCNGTACYIIEYNYRYSQFKGEKGYEMGCLSSPEPFPKECRKNMLNNTLCICNENYCNVEGLINNSTALLLQELTCSVGGLNTPSNPNTCQSNLCATTYGIKGNMDAKETDVDQFCPKDRPSLYNKDVILTTFDLFYTLEDKVMYPAQSCYLIASDDFWNHIVQTCTLTSTDRIPKLEWQEGPIQCRKDTYYQDLTCNASLCISFRDIFGKESMGCIQQSQINGIKLSPGFYSLGMGNFFICATDMCNGELDSFGNLRSEGVNSGETKPIFSNPQDCCPRPEDSAGNDHWAIVVFLLVLCFNIIGDKKLF